MKGVIKEKMTDNFLYLWIFITFILNIFFFVNTIFSCIYLALSSIFLQNIGLEILTYYLLIGISIFFLYYFVFYLLEEKDKIEYKHGL